MEEEFQERLNDLRNDFYEQTGNQAYNSSEEYFDWLIKEIRGSWRLQDKALRYLEDLLIDRI